MQYAVSVLIFHDQNSKSAHDMQKVTKFKARGSVIIFYIHFFINLYPPMLKLFPEVKLFQRINIINNK